MRGGLGLVWTDMRAESRLV
jgi:hypothetical protein